MNDNKSLEQAIKNVFACKAMHETGDALLCFADAVEQSGEPERWLDQFSLCLAKHSADYLGNAPDLLNDYLICSSEQAIPTCLSIELPQGASVGRTLSELRRIGGAYSDYKDGDGGRISETRLHRALWRLEEDFALVTFLTIAHRIIILLPPDGPSGKHGDLLLHYYKAAQLTRGHIVLYPSSHSCPASEMVKQFAHLVIFYAFDFDGPRICLPEYIRSQIERCGVCVEEEPFTQLHDLLHTAMMMDLPLRDGTLRGRIQWILLGARRRREYKVLLKEVLQLAVDRGW